MQIRGRLRPGGETEERDQGVDGHAKSVAQRTQEEPVSDQRRKNHASHNHQDDPYSGVDVVRECETASQEGKQNDLGAEEQDRRRRRRRYIGLRRQGQGRPTAGRR